MAHLFIITGHGAGDPGACANGFSEAERVRALATRIKALGGDRVTLGDFNRDYYADNGISSLDIPADWQITELHMDSAAEEAKVVMSLLRQDLIRISTTMPLQVLSAVFYRDDPT